MEFDLPKETSSIIKVIGVGGGGSNAVNHMYNQGIIGVDFIVCNTDRQALDISPVPLKIQLGPSLTEGRGAGSLPEIGKNAAIENIDEIRELLGKNTKMVFITAGMGGGTGTGAAPVIAEVAREMNILTVGIVTVPFNFEGRKRRQQAEEGLERIRQNVDTLLVINNERLREITGNLTITNAFSQADDILTVAAKGIAEVISVTGSMNVDFNDVNTVMRNSGRAIMGSAAAEGDNRAVNAVQQALASPLLNDNDISGAQYVLLNITYGNKEVLMDEITEITDYIQDEAGSTADVIWGHGYDPSLGDKLSVTLIATGFKSNHPISGFEKAPERTVVTLDLEQKNEIKEQLSSPTQSTPFINAVEVKAPIEEPFMKPESKQESVQEEVVSFVAPSLEVPVSKVEEEPVEKKESLELSWQIQEVNNEVPSQAESKKEGVIVHHLEDDSQAKLDLDNQSTRTVLSPEEQQRKTQERMSRIHDLTLKLKKSEGISEFENEPAYVRRNIQLDNSKPSTEESFSRFGLAEEDNKGVLRNNNFLHDNVD
jgi:cell division protein FtsZ